MATTTNLKPLFLFFISLTFTIGTASTQDQTSFIYTGFRNANLSLDGTAIIQTNGLLQLTNSSNQQMGHAFYKTPIDFNGSNSFSTSFVFAMVTKQKPGGHGLAFVISRSMDFSQATESQYLGLFNISNNGALTNHVLAIEFDTVLSPEFKDVDNNHVGIDVNDLRSVESAPAGYYSDEDSRDVGFELNSGGMIQVWIDYDEFEKLLNVTLSPMTSSRPTRPLLSRYIDLSDVFDDTMNVGFAAATGTPTSDHYILGWSFNKTGKAQTFTSSGLPQLPHSKKTNITIKIALPLAVLVLLLIAVFAYLYWKRKYGEIYESWERHYSPQRFHYKVLYTATSGFNKKEFLGKGGFGEVFRGILPDKKQIAVKRIAHDTKQGVREYVTEIVTMEKLRHKNLVQLLGYCRRKRQLLLVYEYMPNGSLDDYLFGKEKPSLSWSQRFNIIKGVAAAVLYLHEEWEQKVLHRDIKSSNIMLDASFNARLGDFGFARFHDHGTYLETTRIVGTIGYMAPEITSTGTATTCTDVFAFGAFMLEVACGRRPIEFPGKPEEFNLVKMVIQHWTGNVLLQACDPRLEGNYEVEEAEMVLKLGLLCQHFLPEARPSMRQVMSFLVGEGNLPNISVDTPGIGISTSRLEAFEIMSPLGSSGASNTSMYITHSFVTTGR